MKTDRLPAPATDILLALVLLTRLPMPRLSEDAFAHSARAVWAYPLAGLAVGIPAAGAGALALALGVPALAAAGLILGTQMILTCALHEDGLADVADGFWGGQDPEKRLAIMKDSQIGSYGTLALIIITGLRWSALAALLPAGIGYAVAAAVLSRGMMPPVMALLPHARQSGLSHSTGRPEMTHAIAAVCIGFAIAATVAGVSVIPAVLFALLVTAALGRLARSRIGGQTGDVLGATQQLSEAAALVVFAATVL